MNQTEITQYYEELAEKYDVDRFNNTYGKFIHQQEDRFLKKHLPQGSHLNLACGTGRFMEYCTTGLDISKNMLTEAKEKFPDRNYYLSPAHTTPFDNNQFDGIISFHLFMHLDPEQTEAIFREVNRILKPGGIFIFDYPSAERRKLLKYEGKGWHGNNAFSQQEINAYLKAYQWKTTTKQGVVFLPIHRFPKGVRKLIRGMDSGLNRTFLKKYSSYLIHAIQKPVQ